MTIHDLNATHRNPPLRPEPRPPQPPGRHGEPWTSEDYETLVRRCRAGDSLADLAVALQRREKSVVQRAKRLLPLEERGAPEDRVIPHLHSLLSQDEGYDWASHLAATPPPRPVITHLLPPEVRRGIPGLAREELLAVAGLIIRVGHDQSTAELWGDLAAEVERRDLAPRLREQVARASADRCADFQRESSYGPYWESHYGHYPEDRAYDDQEPSDWDCEPSEP